jgi:hypothetical protein
MLFVLTSSTCTIFEVPCTCCACGERGTGLQSACYLPELAPMNHVVCECCKICGYWSSLMCVIWTCIILFIFVSCAVDIKDKHSIPLHVYICIHTIHVPYVAHRHMCKGCHCIFGCLKRKFFIVSSAVPSLTHVFFWGGFLTLFDQRETLITDRANRA